jgi:hypothetical protein
MADVLGGKVITLGSGTLGVSVVTKVQIESITVTWSGASAGNVYLQELTDIESDHSAGGTILSVKTLALASGNVGLLSQTFPFYGKEFCGITKTAMTGVDAELGVQILLR